MHCDFPYVVDVLQFLVLAYPWPTSLCVAWYLYDVNYCSGVVLCVARLNPIEIGPRCQTVAISMKSMSYTEISVLF